MERFDDWSVMIGPHGLPVIRKGHEGEVEIGPHGEHRLRSRHDGPDGLTFAERSNVARNKEGN